MFRFVFLFIGNIINQVIREATTETGDIDVVASYSTAERGVEMQEALRCLVLLTSRAHRALYRALGLSATSATTPVGVEAFLNLAAMEGGASLQVCCERTDPYAKQT